MGTPFSTFLELKDSRCLVGLSDDLAIELSVDLATVHQEKTNVWTFYITKEIKVTLKSTRK